MKLLFVTRKIDRQDSRTSFIFSWLNRLAQKLDRLDVICLEKGDTSGLAANIQIYSMGKERGKSRFKELRNYCRFLGGLVPKTDGILIHMHPTYAIVAWFFARRHRKKLFLWYTHKSVDLKLRLAHALVDEVLTASPESFRLPSKKVKILGHGIDLGRFIRPGGESVKFKVGQTERFKIVSVGRISYVKDYETMIKALEILVTEQKHRDLHLDIYGDPASSQDRSYLGSLHQFVVSARLSDYVAFHHGVPYTEVPALYQQANLFINLSQTGSLDKTVLEAAASGTLVLTCNEAFAGPLRKISPLLFFQNDHPKSLAEKILALKALSASETEYLKQELVAWVRREHSLDDLVKKIVSEFSV